jgi:hypothetical protein
MRVVTRKEVLNSMIQNGSRVSGAPSALGSLRPKPVERAQPNLTITCTYMPKIEYTIADLNVRSHTFASYRRR